MDIHTKASKKFVGRIAATNEPEQVSIEGSWQIVAFSKPAVPLWASADHIDRAGTVATVRVNHLNARIRPSLDSAVVNHLIKGYSSSILQERNGFVQILAPQDWHFAIAYPRAESTAVTQKVETTTQSDKPEPLADIASDSSNTDVPQSTNQSTVLDILKDSVPTEPSIADLHQVAPGDTLSLLVFGETDLSASGVRVPASGLVSFPLIGSTLVAGKTTEQIESMVATKLGSGYVKNPKLSVTIDSYRPIFIRGAVKSTGAFPYTEGLTITKALALAGGMKNSAKTDSISVLRDGETIESNLSFDSQYQINSGDIITVEEEVGVSDESNFYVYLHGEVKKPGEYIFKKGLTVEKAVVLAGGFTLRASKRKISVSRMVEGQQEPEKLGRVKLYLPVQPGDIINVGASWF